MINRAEIIQTLAIRAGMPQIEAGRFMEIFLHKLSELLIGGDVFILNGFGSFEVVKPRHAEPEPSGSDTLVIFRHESSYSEEEDLVFRVPALKTEISNPLDLYFSLGIGKPLIPLKGQKFVPDEIPTSPLELRKFAEMKADAIINKGEIRKGVFLSDYDTIKGQITAVGGSQTQQSAQSKGGFDKHVTWEFGDDWKKEYEADTILAETGNTAEDEFPLEAGADSISTNWDFGGEDEPAGKNEAHSPLHIDLPAPGTTEKNIIPAEPIPYSPVKSPTKELEIDFSEFNEDEVEEEEEQSAEDFDTIFKKSLAENVLMAAPVPDEPLIDTSYQQVRSTREIPPDINLPDDEEDESGPNDSPAFNTKVIDLKPGAKQTQETFVAKGIKGKIDSAGTVKESSSTKWYVLAFILLTVTGAVVYTKLYGVPKWAGKYINKTQEQIITKPIPVVIERDYAFPVTFPYPSQNQRGLAKADEKLKEESLPKADSGGVKRDSSAQAQASAAQTAASKPPEVPKLTPAQQRKLEREQKRQMIEKQKEEEAAKKKAAREAQKLQKLQEKNAEKNVKPREEKKSQQPEAIQPKEQSKQLQKYIFNEGGSFQVQVMSVKVKTIAEDEVGRLQAQGYRAFVMEVNIPNKGTWYRVRVGGLASADEAAKVVSKLKLK